jgi:hypothetical protein
MISLASLGSIVKGGLSLGHFGAQPFGRLSDGKREGGILLRGVCPSNAILLRQTICRHLGRSRPEKTLNVFQRIRLRFFRACGLASASISFPSQRRITRTDS